MFILTLEATPTQEEKQREWEQRQTEAGKSPWKP